MNCWIFIIQNLFQWMDLSYVGVGGQGIWALPVWGEGGAGGCKLVLVLFSQILGG